MLYLAIDMHTSPHDTSLRRVSSDPCLHCVSPREPALLVARRSHLGLFPGDNSLSTSSLPSNCPHFRCERSQGTSQLATD